MHKSDQLRKEGFDVFGSSELTCRMEHDRKFGTSLIEKAGLETPPTHECKTIEDGIRVLEENEDIGFIFKPDEPHEAWTTIKPKSENPMEQNQEMRRVLASFKEARSPFILQEIKEGVEVNLEFFMYNGKPYFAHANFECKKKYNGDLGGYLGCAHDIEFVIPLDCKVLQETLWKLVKLPEFKDYTGPLDMNVIAADRTYYFLEFCARLGYNSHPNLFINLAMDPLSDIFSDMLSGQNLDKFKDHFRRGFGASILLYIDQPVAGWPINVPEEIDKQLYAFDLYRENDEYFLAGYGSEVGIACGFDYDIESAGEEALKNFHKIIYTNRCGRTDISKKDYLSNPQERYLACEAMRLFDTP